MGQPEVAANAEAAETGAEAGTEEIDRPVVNVGGGAIEVELS